MKTTVLCGKIASMKKFLWLGIPILLIVLIYAFGPKPARAKLDHNWPAVPQDPQQLEAALKLRESQHRLRPENEARIIWADSNHQKTPYSLLYLHGFSASHREGYPLNVQLADTLGANLYLSRLAGHGLDTSEQLATFSAEQAWQDAKKALAAANRLGQKVIILSTSTGGTLALKLAATFPEKVHALINLSPNIAIADPSAKLLDGPWGKEIAERVIGEKRYVNQDSNRAYRYWDSLYTVNALVELQRLLSATMTEETFAKINCPVLSLYYYKNEAEHDKVVAIERIPEMHQALGTPDSLHYFRALATPGNHVLASPVKSNDPQAVKAAVLEFCKKTLHTTLD